MEYTPSVPPLLRLGTTLLGAILVLAQANISAYGQGCVAARGGACFHLPGMELKPHEGFQAGVGYRWFTSDRHYVGSHEETQRQAEGSEVINKSHFVDLSVSYAFNPRFSANLAIPFVFHDRSQVIRSNDVARSILQRFHTQATGLGDVRLTGTGWLLDPTSQPRGNVLLGLGVDMPTGEEDETDTFQVFDAASGQIVARERTVDQSIQPGDGGWGLITEIYAFYRIIDRLNLYANGSYLITPEEKNGVPTFRGNPFEAIMSIADTYMGRVGLDYTLLPEWGLTLSFGGRIEGVPVHDAIGESEGFRRPGFSIAVEPGISASRAGWMFNLSAPVAVHRNRERSVPDEQFTQSSGVYRHGDAAFADFAILATITRQF
ncbi:MAG: hypothetical protein IT580_08590 [Verrucomicrobiales bacterium]|nr:hypothetical protein [Verrucomicrobiales bacterium]